MKFMKQVHVMENDIHGIRNTALSSPKASRIRYWVARKQGWQIWLIVENHKSCSSIPPPTL